jgi:hypothetical protein
VAHTARIVQPNPPDRGPLYGLRRGTSRFGGAAIHRQRWSSEDELYDTEVLRSKPEKLERLMRTRLDTALALVKRQPINREQVKHMGDETALRKIVPRPTHQIMLSFGFENSLFLAWDSARRTLVTFMECC